MQADLDHIREIEALTRGGVAGELGRVGGLGRDPKVVESWRRCLEKHRIDPAARAEAYIVPDRQLRAHRERSEDLIAIARSGIDSLYKLVAGQDYVLLLSDAEGVSVEYLGDAAQKEVLRQSGLFLGAEWSEERAGTCAVGTCIETGEALIIHQSDHFDVTHGGLSCTAAPIYNSRGALAAVLDISLLSSPRPRESQHLALNLVLQTTRRIEMANLMAENPREWVLRLAGNPAFLDVDPEAALSLDAGGAVIGMTHSAARLMARTLGTDWRAADQLIGRHLSEVFEVDFDALEGLTRGVAARERVIQTRDGYRLFAHAIEPRRRPQIAAAQPRALPAGLRALAGEDPVMADLLKQAAVMAPAQMPILIRGEIGTGKTKLARAIHEAGRKGPFVTVPCAEIAEEEAALIFGREDKRGTETGLIEAAAGGTLVFEAIESLPPKLQARLVTLLAEGTFRPIGAMKPRQAQARLVFSTVSDPAAAVQDGLLRRDLALRFANAQLALPPLRQRRDLIWLAEHAFSEACGRAVRLDVEGMARLGRAAWDGNFHELTALAMMLDLREGGGTARASAPLVLGAQDLPASIGLFENAEESKSGAVLQRVLDETGWNISETARRLGVNRSTVHRQITRNGMVRRRG